MARRANRTPPAARGVALYFEPHEFAMLKHNEPGPSGLLGGYARMENYLVANTDPQTLRCTLDPVHFYRACDYCMKTDKGGPNARIRAACIPALRRAGIDVAPEWRA